MYTFSIYSDTHSSQFRTPTVDKDVYLPGTLWHLSLTGNSSYCQQSHHIILTTCFLLHAPNGTCTKLWSAEQHGMVIRPFSAMSPLNPRIMQRMQCSLSWVKRCWLHKMTIKIHHVSIDHSAGQQSTRIRTLQSSQESCLCFLINLCDGSMKCGRRSNIWDQHSGPMGTLRWWSREALEADIHCPTPPKPVRHPPSSSSSCTSQELMRGSKGHAKYWDWRLSAGPEAPSEVP